MKKTNKKGKAKYFDPKEFKRTFVSFGVIKLIIFIVIVLVAAGVVALSSFDVTMHCTRETNMCEIKKSSILDPVPVELGRFKFSDAKAINVVNRIVENGKSVYDIELDRGEEIGKETIDFAYNTIIKANTAKMKFWRFYEDLGKREVTINKHCYFNDYFCF